MKNKNNKPYLYYSFSNNKGGSDTFLFTNPQKIIYAYTIDEVIRSLEDVEQAVNEGFYAAGYISYEAAPAFNEEVNVHSENEMPLLWFGLFNEPSEEPLRTPDSFQMKKWKPTVNIEDYNKNIDEIHNYIKKGHTSQVNYTIQMESEFEGDSLGFYKQLKEAQSNYSAYLDIGNHTILSASPELFFSLEDNTITTKPMKGTIERGKTYEEDIQNAKWLSSSEKNRIENKIVVDLMLEELKGIAPLDSINVTSQYDIEKYPTVFQMTSTITADLASNRTITDIFKALFPCGSITGSPKKQTMEIIKELETNPREIYCGAIGFITPNKKATFNVPIRTVFINNNTKKAKYGVGGAITIDSTKEEEYNEILTKAKLLTEKHARFDLLESLGLYDGNYLVLENHLNRLQKSAHYFDFQLNLKEIKKSLLQIAKEHNTGNFKVRLLVNKDGKLTIDIDTINRAPSNIKVSLASKPIDKSNVFLYHKTTNRDIYEALKNECENVYDVLLWNKDKEVTEFTMGNIVIEMDGQLITPPICAGLLGGTYRSALLANGTIVEGTINIADLKKCEKIWFINSVRKWIPVELIKNS